MDSSGFKVLEKKSLSNSDFVTSTKLQISTEAFPSSAHLNLDPPFVGDHDDNIYRHGGGIFGNIFPSTIRYNRPQG